MLLSLYLKGICIAIKDFFRANPITRNGKGIKGGTENLRPIYYNNSKYKRLRKTLPKGFANRGKPYTY